MKKLLAILLTAAIVSGPVSTALAQVTPDLDCIDFPTQADAQDYFDSNFGDTDRLDADADGIACEENDRLSGGTSSVSRSGGGLRRDVGFDASTGRTFQLSTSISPPRTGDGGIR